MLKDAPTHGGVPLTTLSAFADPSVSVDNADPIFELTTDLEQHQWTGIVIHHLGEPAATMQSIHRRHIQNGYQGLGYHFVIGNGNGLGNGDVHIGYRWTNQLPGAHVVGDTGTLHNQHSIAICLVGDGDRRPFTPDQMKNLVRLVQRLQHRLDIPSEAVFLHRELAGHVKSPGRFFAAAELQEGLLQ